jgi:membrane-associated protease RseP (regulator of RpoE activity)
MILFDSIVPFIAIIVVLVIVHELGHFITAKLSGVKVLEFGIGYPPRLWAVTRGETEYSINVLPLGGFVRLLGEEDPSDPRSLAAKPRPIRLVVLSAGSMMNFLLPVLLFTISFMIPREVSVGRAQVAEVVPAAPAALGDTPDISTISGAGDAITASDTPPFDLNVASTSGFEEEGLILVDPGTDQVEQFAYEVEDADTLTITERALGGTTAQDHVAGSTIHESRPLEPGDVIYEIDGREVKNVQETSYNIRLHLGEMINFTVKRDNEFLTIPIKARWSAPDTVHVVQPGDDVQSVADLLEVSPDRVRAAAGIDVQLVEGKEIAIGQGPDAILYVPQENDTVSSVARRLGVDEEDVAMAAGLPDPNKLEVGKELRLPQGPTGVLIGSQYAFTESESFLPHEALRRGIQSTFESLTLARKEVESWIRGGGKPQVSGPVGIAQATGEIVEQAGWRSLLEFSAFLSINLAVINILPLPMLDGGRIMFVLLEIVRGGRRIAPQKEAIVHFIGLVAILVLVVVLSYFDVARLIQGENIFR